VKKITKKTAAKKPAAKKAAPKKSVRHVAPVDQNTSADGSPATSTMKSRVTVPGSPLSETVAAIRAHHRARRHAMGIQQVLDRKLESYIRINFTEWHVDDSEADRKKANEEALALIKAARKGEGEAEIVETVTMSDNSRSFSDVHRKRHEKEMENLAKMLPVAPWVDAVPGLGMLGLATIVAETGDLSNYANVAKVWKRLGYAPYNGKAGSTWKRPTWRGGDPALTSEEWIENPFSAKRYSLLYVISVWLLNTQWTGAAKTEDGIGKPKGPYGEVYAKRQAHTAVTHPDWTKMHSRMDALRIMMKEVLKDLWLEWQRVTKLDAAGRQHAADTRSTSAANRDSDPNSPEAHA
jgi:hypothetical protein